MLTTFPSVWLRAEPTGASLAPIDRAPRVSAVPPRDRAHVDGRAFDNGATATGTPSAHSATDAFAVYEGYAVLCDRIQSRCAASRARLVYAEQRFAQQAEQRSASRERQQARHALRSTARHHASPEIIDAEIIDEADDVLRTATWVR